MSEENSDIQIGEVPILIFIPEPIPPDSTIPANKVLVISSPALYIHVRDLAVMYQTQRRAKEANEALDHLMKEILKYKPKPNGPSLDTTFLNPAIFNIEEWLEGDGESEEDNEL